MVGAEIPYEPPFEMPDYKVVGRQLMALGWTPPIDETLDIKYARPIDKEINAIELLETSGASNWERPVLPDISKNIVPLPVVHTF